MNENSGQKSRFIYNYVLFQSRNKLIPADIVVAFNNTTS